MLRIEWHGQQASQIVYFVGHRSHTHDGTHIMCLILCMLCAHTHNWPHMCRYNMYQSCIRKQMQGTCGVCALRALVEINISCWGVGELRMTID